MDSMITAAAQALASGDALGALNRVALRNDAPALALRGIAMARLGDLERARALLREATQAFGAKESVARARSVLAEAEIAFVSRDLTWPERHLASARTTLETRGDKLNAAHAGALQVRRLLLLGRLDEAEHALGGLNAESLPPALRAAHELVVAGIALRRLHCDAARVALDRAVREAQHAGIPALIAEVEHASGALSMPAARWIEAGRERMLRLNEVETGLASPVLLVDAFRHAVRDNDRIVSLAGRPVLFALARMLAEAAPNEATREALIAGAFRMRFVDETHRARLRVEMGRLRTLLRDVAEVTATRGGFVLTPLAQRRIAVLARPIDEEHAHVLALLGDGNAWSSSALALALDVSQRSIQRALDALAADGKVQAVGRGRARRWMVPLLPEFTTTLLLPAALINP